MGDRIAILKEGARVAQYDTPEQILTDPADEFVENFIGAGASLKRLSLSRVKDIETADWPVARLTESHEAVRETIRRFDKSYVLLLDGRDRPKRWVRLEDLDDGIPLSEAGWPAVAVVEAGTNLYETLDIMITSYKGSAIVVDKKGAYEGVVDFETVLEAIDSMRSEESSRSPEDVSARGE